MTKLKMTTLAAALLGMGLASTAPLASGCDPLGSPLTGGGFSGAANGR